MTFVPDESTTFGWVFPDQNDFVGGEKHSEMDWESSFGPQIQKGELVVLDRGRSLLERLPSCRMLKPPVPAQAGSMTLAVLRLPETQCIHVPPRMMLYPKTIIDT